MAEPVHEMLGEPICEKILDEVSCGRISEHQALDIAYKLHEHVGGEFRISKSKYNRRAFKVMLTNWHNTIGYDETRDTVIQKLLEVLRDPDISLLPLAKSIERLHCQSPDNTQRPRVDMGSPAEKITRRTSQRTEIHGDVGVYVEGSNNCWTVGSQQFGNNNTQITTGLAEDLEKLVTARQKEFLSKNQQTLTTLAEMPGFASTLVQFSTILESVCMIGGGTGFLAEIPNIGIVFFSAGHVFFDIEKEPPQYINPANNKYKLHFGNISGSEDGDRRGKYFSFKDFNSMFQLKGSISYEGQLHSFPTASNSVENSNKEEDYCALLVTAPNTKDLLKKKGLTYLACGKDEYLNSNEDEIVSIFGHPKVDEDARRPLRVCWGRELKNSASMNRIFYNNDTLPGNSGSPVIARGLKRNGEDQAYVVKGIHVQGNPNRAQILKNLTNWIPPPPYPSYHNDHTNLMCSWPWIKKLFKNKDVETSGDLPSLSPARIISFVVVTVAVVAFFLVYNSNE